jgi:hypothetical protein
MSGWSVRPPERSARRCETPSWLGGEKRNFLYGIVGIQCLFGGYAIAHAMWVHGTSLQVEVDGNVESIRRYGFYTRVIGKADTTNWYHFAIPTPVIVSGKRLEFARAMLRFVTGGTNTSSEMSTSTMVPRDSSRTSSSICRVARVLQSLGSRISRPCSGEPASRSECRRALALRHSGG